MDAVVDYQKKDISLQIDCKDGSSFPRSGRYKPEVNPRVGEKGRGNQQYPVNARTVAPENQHDRMDTHQNQKRFGDSHHGLPVGEITTKPHQCFDQNP